MMQAQGYGAVGKPRISHGPRPLFKTVGVCLLFCLVPIIGVSLATTYWLTRHEPDRFRADDAIGAGIAVFLMSMAAFVVFIATLVVVIGTSKLLETF